MVGLQVEQMRRSCCLLGIYMLIGLQFHLLKRFLKLSFTFLRLGHANNPPFNQFVALVPGMIWDSPLSSCCLPEVSLQRFAHLVHAEQFDLSKTTIIYHIIKGTIIGNDQGRTVNEGIPPIHSLGCDFFWHREVSWVESLGGMATTAPRGLWVRWRWLPKAAQLRACSGGFAWGRQTQRAAA